MVSLLPLAIAVVCGVIGLGSFGVAAGVGWYGWQYGAETDRAGDAGTTAVEDVAPGEVEIEGTARPVEGTGTLAGHLSGTDALVSSVYVEEHDEGSPADGGTNGRGGNWRTIYADSASLPFLVDDGTGEIRVDPPSEGRIALEETREVVDRGEEPPEQVRRFVDRTGAVESAGNQGTGPDYDRRRRYTEGLLEPGEVVYVLGEAVESEDGYVVTGGSSPGAFVLSEGSGAQADGGNGIGDWMFYALSGAFALFGAGVLLAAVGLAAFALL